MKSVLISIQPKWCEIIKTCLGYENRRPLYKKRLDLRKSAPQETPFKAYIYETQALTETPWIDEDGHEIFKGRGKVICEFICDYVVRHCEMSNADLAEEMSCVPREDILKYSNGKEVFGWHISDLVIYKKPRELSEFTGLRKTKFGYEPVKITRPPQSWCYVESEDKK